MNKIKKGLVFTLVISLMGLLLAACGGNEKAADEGAASETKKDIKIGVAPGPYGDMITKAIAPYMEKQGYKIEVVQFSDYVQPDQALGSGEIDANLMQHTVYLNKFAADNKLDIGKVISVPTAGMGVYSNTVKNLSDLPDGSKVAIAVDASNLARSLRFLKALGLIDLKADIDATKATVHDVSDNPHKLEFVTMDAAQISRSLDSVAIGLIPGNFAIAAKLDLANAIAVEKLTEDYKNVVAVRTADIDGQLGKDLKAAVESEEFHQAIEDANGIFKAFDKPEWYTAKYGK
ncbi:MetQ/NlpA family ABC transporter substrate-binding protein [Paenibacillus sabinae]|uniref:Metal ion ABC transporter substrate-binding protein/surface antigen n=1 Tax=Paenibacillus sabinae T27 TaxID=1268072 RepID=X4ZXB2_9BACL|nr:MetQ/NlpA family ABC transporter substrate-binding protein [Paenibacillus sabinae]AHV96828.1 metal ion ABC transporter substrate-binding protein/surface antigen [Paenibacillus sabinae T27]